MNIRLSCFLVFLSMFFLSSCDSNTSNESCLTVTPNESYTIAGSALSQDFTPAVKTYTVRNTCDTDVMISVEEDVRWLDVDIDAFGGGGNEAGLLASGITIDVDVEVRYGSDNPQRLDQLDPGMYETELSFIDETNNAQTIRPVNLTVAAP